MNIRNKLCFLFLSFICSRANSQTFNPFFQLPQVVTASPEAGSLLKMESIPVNYTNGTANLSIPIYTVNDGGISIPISINYNTGGIKVQDISSMIGLGWVLNFGGAINIKSDACNPALTVDNSAFKTSAAVSTGNTYSALQFATNITLGTQEKQKPIYYFSFGKYSGSFFYDVNNQLYINGNRNLKINKAGGAFVITTDEGIQYTFGAQEQVLVISSWQRPSALFISKIVDLNTNRTVTFKYKGGSYTEFHDVFSTYYCTPPDPQGQGVCGMQPYGNKITRNISVINKLVIDSIIFSSGYVKFFSSADRLDIDPTRITRISVYDNGNNEIKRVQFYQNYFVSSGAHATNYNYRMRLDSLSFIDPLTGNKLEPYGFFYNTSFAPPYTRASDLWNNPAIDYWGYYNGHNNNAGPIPRDIIPPGDFTSYQVSSDYLGDRKVDTNCAQAFSLARIKYPTGGYIQFAYESNRVPGFYLGDIVGGLRIKYISYYTDWSSSTPARQQYFKYDSAKISKPFYSNDFIYAKVKSYLCSSNACPRYPEYCKTDYWTKNVSSDPIGMDAYFQMAPFYYQVEEINVGGPVKRQKTVYYYDKISQFETYPWIAPEYDGLYFAQKDWLKDKLLLRVEGYRTNSDGSYNLLRKEVNEYQDLYESAPTLGVHAVTRDYYDFCGYQLLDYDPLASYSQALFGFNFHDALASTGVRYLQSKTITEYGSTDSLVTRTEYYYNSNDYVNLTAAYNSKGDLKRTAYYYPTDKFSLYNLTPSTSAAIDSLVSRNIIAHAVQKEESSNFNLTSRDMIFYKVWSNTPNNLVLPESQQMQVLSGNADTRLQFFGYDGNGNLLSFGKNAGQRHSYIWGYNGTYVIADAGNAGQSEIAYTSFEDNLLSSGGWTLPSSARTVNDGVTGNQYLASPGIISGPAINASVKYIVSYWTKNATPFTISGTQSGYPIKGKTINSWTYYEHVVSGVSAVSLTVSGSIDELRLYPKSGQMITYAFKPLIGMSEKCDEANRITRYRYEAFNRLYMILDQDRNVIKKFDYNYDFHPEKNSIIYFSKEVSGKYVRNNCTAGYLTDTVVYTVPYGTYTSLSDQTTADALAYNDLIGNGQTYANSVGQCTAPQMVNVTYTNTISQNFRLQMTNTATNVTYVFILAPNTTTSTVAGQVPQGTYSGNIRAVPDLGNLHNFNFCGHIETNVYSTNFANIPIMCGTCATASVY